MAIKSYGYKPSAIIHRTPNCSQKEYTFGVEVEVGCLGLSRDGIESDYDRMFNSSGFTYHKEDGSLSAVNGFEIVSHPGTLAYHESINWAARNDWMDAAGVKSHNTTKCGLHIHIGKKGMSKKVQVRFGAFINRQKENFEKIARRENSTYAKFIAMPTWYEGMNEKMIFELPNTYEQLNNKRGDRYRAVNYKNSKTIEVRIFKGTLKTSTLLASITLLKAIAIYCKTADLQNILDQNTAASWGRFCNWLNARRAWTQTLVNYMMQRRVMILTTAPAATIAPVTPATRTVIATPGACAIIRAYVRAHTTATANQIANAMAEQGVRAAMGTIRRQRAMALATS